MRNNLESRSRANTAPLSLVKNKRQRRHRPGSDQEVCRRGREESQNQNENDDQSSHRGGGEDIVTLEEAVVDFDVALRDHRNKRKRLVGSMTTVLSGGNASDDENVRGKHSSNAFLDGFSTASSWLDGERTSWAAVPLEGDDLRKLPCREKRENEKKVNGREDCSEEVDMEIREATTVQTNESHFQNVPNSSSPRCDEFVHTQRTDGIIEGGRTPPCDRDLELVLNVGPTLGADCKATPITDKHELSVNAVGSREGAGQPLCLDSELSVKPPEAPLPGAIAAVKNTEADFVKDVSHTRELQGPDNSDPGNGLQSSPNSRQMSPVPDSPGCNAVIPGTAPREEVKVRGRHLTEPMPSELDAAANPSRYDVETVETMSSKNKTPPIADATTSQSMAVAQSVPTSMADSPAVTAPAVTAAMEPPDLVATTEQRTAKDWMEGTISGHPPTPLTVAEAEADLVEKLDRLQSKRLVSERNECEAQEEGITKQLGQEQAIRAASFTKEDREVLIVEERRLAEVRREADLGRLQRGIEFEEAEDALANVGAMVAATQDTAVPVRGMRPQHYNEEETLPDSIKQAVALLSADKILDEMEDLATRAKVSGKGLSVEEFEKVEQKQQVRQIERIEILHGQTAEEKKMTMLKMTLRLQKFARSKAARIRVARLREIRSGKIEKVSCSQLELMSSINSTFFIRLLGQAYGYTRSHRRAVE